MRLTSRAVTSVQLNATLASAATVPYRMLPKCRFISRTTDLTKTRNKSFSAAVRYPTDTQSAAQEMMCHPGSKDKSRSAFGEDFRPRRRTFRQRPLVCVPFHSNPTSQLSPYLKQGGLHCLRVLLHLTHHRGMQKRWRIGGTFGSRIEDFGCGRILAKLRSSLSAVIFSLKFLRALIRELLA